MIFWQISGGFEILQTFSFDLSAIAEIYILRLFLTTENEFVVIAVIDSAANSLERFVDFVDSDLRVDVTIDDVDAHAHDAASGVTTSGTSGNFDDFALRAKLASRGPPYPLTYHYHFYV